MSTMKTLIIRPADVSLNPLGAESNVADARVSVVYDRDVWVGGQPVPRVTLLETSISTAGLRVPVLASDDPSITEGAGFVIKVIVETTPRIGPHNDSGTSLARTIQVVAADPDEIPLGSKPNLTPVPDPTQYADVMSAIKAAAETKAAAAQVKASADGMVADVAASKDAATKAASSAAAAQQTAANMVGPTDAGVAQLVQSGEKTNAALAAQFDSKGAANIARFKVSDGGLYVSPSGSDNNDGLSPGAARATLASAATSANQTNGAATRITLTRGRHTIPSAGITIDKAVTIQGTGGVTYLQDSPGASSWTSASEDQVGGTVLTYAGSGTALNIPGKASTRGVVLRDMVFLGTGAAGSVGLAAGNQTDSQQLIRPRIDNVLLANFGTGLSSTAENGTFVGVTIIGCGTGLYTCNAFNGNTIVGLDIETCSNYGMFLTQSDSNVFMGGVMQGNKGTVVQWDNNVLNNSLQGYYFENSLSSATMVLGSATGKAVDGNYIMPSHFGGTLSPITVNGNQNVVEASWKLTPSFTINGNWNRVSGIFNSGLTDNGTGNSVDQFNSGNSTRSFRYADVRLDGNKKLYLENPGSNAYIGKIGANVQIGMAAGTALDLTNIGTSTTAPAAGSAGALPSAPTGYMKVVIGGTARLIPYY